MAEGKCRHHENAAGCLHGYNRISGSKRSSLLHQALKSQIIKRLPAEQPKEPTYFEKGTGMIAMHAVPMARIIRWAYGGLRSHELDGPAWINSEHDGGRYDLKGKFPPTVTPGDVRVMVQKLLEERVGMKAHFETREMAAYSVAVGPKGIKAERSKPDETAVCDMREIYYPRARIQVSACTIENIIDKLELRLKMPMIDRTNLDTADRFTALFPVSHDQNMEPESFVHYVIHQLALTIAKKNNMPVKVLVVDSIQKDPTGN